MVTGNVDFKVKRKDREKPVTDKILSQWLDQNIEDPEKESKVMIPHDTRLNKLVYKSKEYPTAATEVKRENQFMAGQRNSNRNSRRRNGHEDKYARAPYNFIPLNDQVVFPSENCDFDKYIEDRYTGSVTVRLENLTALFIRQITDSSESFGYNNQYGIPGSSFRGLIRQLCEVLSFGKFGRFNDQNLYYRGIEKNMQEVKSGVLEYDDEGFKLYPCHYAKDNSNRLVDKPNKIIDQAISIILSTGKFGGGKFSIFKFTNISDTAEYIITNRSKVYTDYLQDINRSLDTYNVFSEAKKRRFPIFYQVKEGKVFSLGFAKYHRIPYDKSIADHIPDNLRTKEPDFSSRIVWRCYC